MRGCWTIASGHELIPARPLDFYRTTYSGRQTYRIVFHFVMLTAAKSTAHPLRIDHDSLFIKSCMHGSKSFHGPWVLGAGPDLQQVLGAFVVKAGYCCSWFLGSMALYLNIKT